MFYQLNNSIGSTQVYLKPMENKAQRFQKYNKKIHIQIQNSIYGNVKNVENNGKVFFVKIGHTVALWSAILNAHKNQVIKSSPNYCFFAEDKTTAFCTIMWFYTTFSDNELKTAFWRGATEGYVPILHLELG